MDRIENREALEQVRGASKAQIENSRCRILICAGTGCLAGGSGQIYERMCELVKEHPDVEVHFGPEIAHGDGEIGVKKSGCHGFFQILYLRRLEHLELQNDSVIRSTLNFRINCFKAGAEFIIPAVNIDHLSLFCTLRPTVSRTRASAASCKQSDNGHS